MTTAIPSAPAALRDFAAAARAVVAPGAAAACLAREAAACGELTWAVVCDRGFAEAGGLDPLLAGLEPGRTVVLSLVDEDSGIVEVEALWEEAVAVGAEGVIAVGGGSGLCAGKGVAIRLTNPAPLDGYRGRDRLRALPAPCLAVPTTAGSGSEVSEVIILHPRDESEELVIRGRGYAPRVAVLDGELLATLPPRPMILAAVDALAHAHESLWSRGATSFTDALALAAAPTIRATLGPALEGDAGARQRLLEASSMANYACGNAGLTAVHALASAPTVRVPHGRQVGVLLPHVAESMMSVLRPEVAAEIEQLDSFYEEIGFGVRFTAEEVGEDDLEPMVAAALANPLIHNDPRRPGAADLRAMVERACGA